MLMADKIIEIFSIPFICVRASEHIWMQSASHEESLQQSTGFYTEIIQAF